MVLCRESSRETFCSLCMNVCQAICLMPSLKPVHCCTPAEDEGKKDDKGKEKDEGGKKVKGKQGEKDLWAIGSEERISLSPSAQHPFDVLCWHPEASTHSASFSHSRRSPEQRERQQGSQWQLIVCRRRLKGAG